MKPFAVCRLLIFCALSALVPAGIASAQNTDAAAQKVLRESDAAVNVAALRRMHFLEFKGNGTFGGLKGTATSWVQVGGPRFAESYSNPPVSGGDGYDGTSVWNRDGSGLVWVDGGEAGRSQAISQAFVLDYGLIAPNHGDAVIKYAGAKTQDNHPYDVLNITAPGSAVPFELWFDGVTHLPMRMTQTIGPTTSTLVFSDFRSVRGVMMPFASASTSSDGNAAQERITHVVVDPPGAQTRLRRPKSDVHDFSIAGGAAATTVPITLADNHVYLSVSLNGKGPYHFVYDSGGANIVDPAVAREIGAVGTGSVQGGGVGSATESVSFATVKTMTIGNALVQNQLFGVAPTRLGFGISSGQPVDGLIGFEVLSRFISTFDYANKRVTLALPGHAPQQDSGAGVLPFVFDERQPQFTCTIDGVASQCTVDTGARDSISLYGPFLAAHPQIVPSQLSAVGVNGFGFGGPALGRLGRLRSLGIGGFTLPDLVGDFTTQTQGAFAEPFVAANVGGNVWKRFTLTLNYYDHTISLTPNAQFQDPDSCERAGLFLLNQGGKYVVLDARPNAPAALAGIEKGDAIVSVNGRPASAMTLADVRNQLMRRAGTVLELVVAKPNGTQRTVVLTLRDFV